VPTTRAPLWKKLLSIAPWLAGAVLLLRGAAEYAVLFQIPGWALVWFFPPGAAGLYFLARRRLVAPPAAFFASGILLVGLAVAEIIQFIYLPLRSEPPGAAHPAVEILVNRAALNELGIGPFLEGAFFAPGESDRDLYLFAGQPRRSYLSPVVHIAARNLEEKESRWRKGSGQPFVDAAWMPQTGEILALYERPPALLLLDPLKLDLRQYVEWRVGGMPQRIAQGAPGARRVAILAAGEGEAGWFDPASRQVQPLAPLAPQARALGATLPSHTFAPYEVSAPLPDGRRIVTSWQGFGLILYVDSSWRVLGQISRPARRAGVFLNLFRTMGAAADPARNRLWVADSVSGFTGTLLELPLGSLSPGREYRFPPGIRRLAYDEKRGRLYVADTFGGSLFVFDASGPDLILRNELQLGRWLKVLQWESDPGGMLLAGSAGGLFRINPDRL